MTNDKRVLLAKAINENHDVQHAVVAQYDETVHSDTELHRKLSLMTGYEALAYEILGMTSQSSRGNSVSGNTS
jgi:hypothetical protein